MALPLCGQTATQSAAAQINHQAQGQPASGAAATTLHVEARTVVVDVVATDARDQPVQDLGIRDFQVLEDGRPQQIAYFEAHMAAPAKLEPAEKLPPGIFSNAPVTAPADAVNLILMDALNTPLRDQVFVRQAMEKYLDTTAPGASLAMFALDARLRLVQGFTSDIAALRTAIDSPLAHPQLSPLLNTAQDNANDQQVIQQIEQAGIQEGSLRANPLSNAPANPLSSTAVGNVAFARQTLQDTNTFKRDERVNMTLEALQQIARYLGGIPGRKNLIWFSGAFPFAIFPDPTMPGYDNTLLQGANVREYKERLDRTAALLTAAQVAIYPIDPKGADGAGKLTEQATMEELASQTGGEAFYNRNNLGDGVARAVENGSHYYTIAYTPTNSRVDGTYRNIEVMVEGRKLHLNYRKGYFATEASPPPGDPLRSLMDPGMPNFSQVLYKMLVQPTSPQPAATSPRAGDNAAVQGPVMRETVLFRIEDKDLDFTPAPDGSRKASLEVAIVAYDANGKPVNWLNRTIEAGLNAPAPGAPVQRAIAFPLQIDLPANAATLRTGVYEAAGSKAGTLELPVAAIAGASMAAR